MGDLPRQFVNMPSLEVRLPIAPRPGFFSNVRLAAASLARLGEPYSSAQITISVGDHANPEEIRAANRWSENFPVVWRCVPPAVCDAEGPGWAVHLDKFETEACADIVLMCDADVCAISRFDELLDALESEHPRIAGMNAHYSPFVGYPPEINDAEWRRLLDDCGLPHVPLRYTYSVASRAEGGSCPAYFNNGFVAFNRSAFQRLREHVHPWTRWAFDFLADRKFFAAQVGLAVAIAKEGVEVIELGPAYNCPSSDEMLGRGLAGVEDIKVVHYLRTEEFDRHAFLCEPAAFEAFTKAQFTSVVNEHFRRHVLSLPDVASWSRGEVAESGQQPA
jgi:hypothetical protein